MARDVCQVWGVVGILGWISLLYLPYACLINALWKFPPSTEDVCYGQVGEDDGALGAFHCALDSTVKVTTV